MLNRVALYIARVAAAAIRPLEALALLSLKGFTTRRGPLLFFAAIALVIGSTLALIVFAQGTGHAAVAKIVIGLLTYALFLGYARAFFAVRAEAEARRAGLAADPSAPARYDGPPDALEGIRRDDGAPRHAGVLNLFGLGVFTFGLIIAFTATCAGIAGAGLGITPLDDLSLPVTPTGADWLWFALWSSVGMFDIADLGPRADEPIGLVRYEWGGFILLLVLFRLTLIGILFSLLAAWFAPRRAVSIALSAPGLWLEKREHVARLGPEGFVALAAALGDPEPARREDAARLLGGASAYPEAAAEQLAAALSDGDASVRARAAESLGALGPAAAGATNALIERLQDPEAAVRREAAAALGRTAEGRPNLASAAMAALAAVAPEDAEAAAQADWDALIAIANSLAELAESVGFVEEEAVRSVDRLRGHSDGFVRQVAVETYGRLWTVAQA